MTPTPAATTQETARLGLNDPLLQELWAVKATMNAETGYSIHKLAEQAREFDLEATLTRLRQLVGH
jgi:hypothetical protein